MKFEKGLWYFAHPYTAKDPHGNYVSAAEDANFILANIRASELLKRGYSVYSPISHTHPIHVACPEFLANHEHELWYEIDNHLIARVEFKGIILAPGWEESTGCCDERGWFEHHDKMILLYEDVIKEPIIYGVEK